jgi:hypothetical protein
MLIDIVSIHHFLLFMYERNTIIVSLSHESITFITCSIVCRMDVVFAITQEIIRGNHLAASKRNIETRVGCCVE